MRSLTPILSMTLAVGMLAACDTGTTGPAATVTGDFEANRMEFVQADDPTVRDDRVGAGSEFNVRLNQDGTFTSTFTDVDAEPVESSGTVTVAGDQMTFSRDPFLAPSAAAPRAFTFERTGERLTLTDDQARHDFGDGTLRDATFEMELQQF